MPCSPTNDASSTAAVSVDRPARTPPASRETWVIQPASPSAVHTISTAASGPSAARAASRAVRAAGGNRDPSAASGSLVAAPISPPSAPHSRPSANALPGGVAIRVVSLFPPTTANASISRANGTATSAAQPSRASGGAPSVRYSCQRVVRTSAPSGNASSTSGWMRRVPETSIPGSSTIAVSNVPTACRNVSVTRLASIPTAPRIEFAGVTSASRSPAASTTPADTAAATAAATIPGTASRSRTIPERSAGPAGGSVAAFAGASSCRGGSSSGGGLSSSGASSRRGGGGGGGGGPPAAQAASDGAGGGGGDGRRSSSRCAPHAEQKRARALSRSPQFGQKMVSGTRSPVASVASYGYHLRPMEALCGS
jgi:hypothetical protein